VVARLREPAIRRHIGERFGYYRDGIGAAPRPLLWVHAVSVGEARASAAWCARWPRHPARCLC
jgi:3-deoxy-D-manno-octulosonic-acid transferase